MGKKNKKKRKKKTNRKWKVEKSKGVHRTYLEKRNRRKKQEIELEYTII